MQPGVVEGQFLLLYYISSVIKCKAKYTSWLVLLNERNLFSKLLTSILSAVKIGRQRYRDISYTIGGVNQMWILKIFKDLSKYIHSKSLSWSNIKTFNFCTLFTLYTTIPHSKLNHINRITSTVFQQLSNKGYYFDISIEIDNGGRLKTKLYNIGYSHACAVIFGTELSG
jgi:hypothetical protein